MGLNCLDDRVPFRRSGRARRGVPKFWIFVAVLAVYGLSYVFFAGRGKRHGIDAGADTVWAFHRVRAHECLSERALFVVYYPLIRVDRALGYRHVFDGGSDFI